MSKFSMPVIGATGKREVKPFFQPIKCKIGNRVLTHGFLYMPECPLLLMGWELLNKLGAQITFDKNKVQVHIAQNNAWKAQAYMSQKALDSKQVESGPSGIPAEVIDAVVPFVWATEKPGRARCVELVKVELRQGAKSVRRKQYPMKSEARVGLEPIINNFFKCGLLRECTILQSCLLKKRTHKSTV